MKRLHFLLLILGFHLIHPGTGHAGAPPNILLIYIDDMGWKDPAFMGSDFYETPHLDQLAREGMVFTDAYSAAANCAPARACLLSGQYTPRHEIYNVGTGPRGNAAHRRLKHIPGTDTLRTDIPTWAQVLQKGGYATAIMGKWHLSDDPTAYGFDLNIGGSHSGGPPNGYYPPHGKVPGLKDAPREEYLTDRLSEEAVHFITENREKPWLLYLSHFAVHTPLQARKDLIEKYKNKAPGTLHQHAVMATMIQAVDEGVGRIEATLKALGIKDQTVVIFTSDNGGYGPATDMDPLKGYKGTYYEGGIRVPFCVRWPGVIRPSSRSAEPISGVDLYPTLCAIAGISPPADHGLDGRNLLPLFKGDVQNLGGRALFWHFPAYLQSYGAAFSNEQRDPLFRSRPCSIIRVGDWKLHQYFEDEGLELYNLAEDIGEAHNLAATHPSKTRELMDQLLAWQRSTQAPIPREPNPEFNADAEAAAIRKLQ